MRIVTGMTRRVQVCTSSVCDLGYHLVCHQKYRRPVLAGPGAGRDQELVRANAGKRDWRIVALETMPGHLHLFVNAHPSHSPSPAASQLKRLTSVCLRAEFPRLQSRLPALWSRSCFAVTMGAVSAKIVRRCAGTQNERSWRKERAR